MTEEEKSKKFDEIQTWLWEAARSGNTLQSTVAAGLIRVWKVESPEGDGPDDA